MVYEEFEGNGYMTEAATRLKSFAFETLGWSTLVSYISRENVPLDRPCEAYRWTNRPRSRWSRTV